MNAWESVFLQSSVNDGHYDEDRLPQLKWDWPKGTWFQSRLYVVRERHAVLCSVSGRKMKHSEKTGTM